MHNELALGLMNDQTAVGIQLRPIEPPHYRGNESSRYKRALLLS